MEAELTINVGSRLVHKGETFDVANEEDARLYEEKGLARKNKATKPSRTQDVQKEEPQPARRGRPPKTRKTKTEGDSEQEVEDGDSEVSPGS